eukprot:gene2427-2997_t
MEFLKLCQQILKEPIKTIENFRWVTDVTPFSSISTPLIASFSYLFIIYLLQNFMKNRKEIKLHSFALFHNLFLSLLSLVMFCGVIYYPVYIGFTKGFYDMCCTDHDNGYTHFWYYVFYLSKVYEFVDTFIQVLRKKQLIFLHVYHHFITFWLCWVNLRERTGVQWADISANCFVHIVMYFYYFQCERKISPWWKKYITVVQIIQFVFDITFHLIWHYYHSVTGGDCSGTIAGTWFSNFVILSFLVLFLDFFIKSYTSKRSITKKTE